MDEVDHRAVSDPVEGVAQRPADHQPMAKRVSRAFSGMRG